MANTPDYLPVVTVTTTEPGTSYTLTMPNKEQVTLGNSQDDYWVLADLIDRLFETARCRESAHHAEGTGYFDPNGHEITQARWLEVTKADRG